MALTRVSPALFQVSNNITSVTVGGSANTISLTFDSNGVITGASNNALLISNTAITGNIVSSQITSVANTQITGNITAAQITSVANTQLTGLIQAAQIGSANATLITAGTLPTARLPTGTVLQVVAANTSTAVVTTTTGAYVDTGITATITPTSASSKIMVLINLCGLWKSNSNLWNRAGIKMLRGATTIGIEAFSQIYSGTTMEFRSGGLMYSKLDSPGTTSATTYKLQFQSEVVGDNTALAVQKDSNSGESQIFLMEISA